MRARLTLVTLLVAQAGAVRFVATHPPAAGGVDWRDPVGWLRATDPETATLVVARGLVLLVAGWLLATTVLALAGRVVAALPGMPERVRRVAARAARGAPRGIRHLVEAAVVVAVATGAATPAGAAPAPRPGLPASARPLVAPIGPVRDGRSASGPSGPAGAAAPPTTPPTPTTPTTRPLIVLAAPVAAPAGPSPAPVSSTPSAVPSIPTAVPPAGGGHHRVAAGEHLWGIAEATLAEHGIDDPAAVDRYWRALCDANRDHLVSRDVDVLAVGEDVDLPPVA